MGIPELIIAILFLAIGFALAFFMARTKQSRLEERNAMIRTESDDLKQKLEVATREKNDVEKHFAELTADHRNLKVRLHEQKHETGSYSKAISG
jgi:chromosome segregation ATPase